MGEPAMTRLARLRARLNRLRERRRAVRLGIGYLGIALAIVWAFLAVFLADWLLAYLGGPRWEMNRPQRVIVFVVAAGVVLWAIRRYSASWFGHRESLVDMALLVQRQQHIDSDLVAAIQFESPDASRWGSVAMEQAVIERVADVGAKLRPAVGLPTGKLKWRAAALALTAGLIALAIWQFPDHARVFANRLLLGSMHYPTRTSIASLAINQQPVDLAAWGPQQVKSHYGKPVRFEVVCAGDLPAEGEARVKSGTGGLETSVTLGPGEKDGVYVGELSRLVDAAECQVYLGDAWTEPVRLTVVPPASVDVELEITAPSYSSGAPSAPEKISGLRQHSVMEGSRIVIRAIADKSLHDATLSVEDKQFPLARQGEQAAEGGTEVWVLDPKGTPLAAVAEPVRYALQVTDVDGLQLDKPIEGLIRIKTDHPPQVYGSAVTQVVLPKARPTIRVAASDDYGLSEVAIVAEVIRGENEPAGKSKTVIYTPAKDEAPRKGFQDSVRFSLDPLKANVGDQVKITLRAVDYRGSAQAGRTTLSEPLVFQVTDERGIIAAITAADPESARQLQDMINQQIGVGDER
jgi:hypothetical protein